MFAWSAHNPNKPHNHTHRAGLFFGYFFKTQGPKNQNSSQFLAKTQAFLLKNSRQYFKTQFFGKSEIHQLPLVTFLPNSKCTSAIVKAIPQQYLKSWSKTQAFCWNSRIFSKNSRNFVQNSIFRKLKDLLLPEKQPKNNPALVFHAIVRSTLH